MKDRSNLTATVSDKSSTLSPMEIVSEATPNVSTLCSLCGQSYHVRSICRAKMQFVLSAKKEDTF